MKSWTIYFLLILISGLSVHFWHIKNPKIVEVPRNEYYSLRSLPAPENGASGFFRFKAWQAQREGAYDVARIYDAAAMSLQNEENNLPKSEY